MANINNKPDIQTINRFSNKLFKLKKLSFLYPLYEDALQEIKNIYRYITLQDNRITELSIELNKEREARAKLQLYIALTQVEANKKLIRHSIPYFKGVDITEYFVKDTEYYNQFKKAYE